jgi:signal transduction histidine kinase
MRPPELEMLLEMSREVSLACDPHGLILWADDRAARLLGAREGAALEALAAPGTERKVAQLVTTAATRAVHRWELAMVVQGALATLAFEARPIPEGAVLVGSLVPDDYAAALSKVAATMSALAELHRKSEDQRRELRRRHDDLVRLHRDLAESSRAIVALHAELDEKVDTIHRVSEAKTRVIASVSHELRTPINTILGLTSLLVDRSDGELTDEQAKQIGLIRASAEALSLLTNDLLDLSLVEGGKRMLQATTCDMHRIFAALRGMLRPLIDNDAVELVVEDPTEPIRLDTDEGKLAQILRNLVINALKFTERGEVRVSARPGPQGTITLSVSDTGIGIAPENQVRIFEEFAQIEGPLQIRAKGAGLGLALSRKLADLLGGDLTVESALGAGSTFSLTIPGVVSGGDHPQAGG